MARPKKFSSFEKDVESYILARMVVTRQSGLFSYGGLLGWGDVDPAHYQDISDSDYSHQYDTYLSDSSFQNYWPKESNPGFQGLFFSLLDRLSPFSPSINLRLFRMLTSGLFALALTGLILWFYLEFGWLSAICVLGSCLASQWITLFGRNLFFFSWAFYFPMLVLLFRLRSEDQGNQLLDKRLFWLVFGLVLFKCLFNGYDFITPTLGMLASPIVFYGILNRWNRNKFVRRFALVVLASLLAILASLLILTIQNLFATGSLQAGMDFIIQTIFRRTYSVGGGSAANAANNVSVWTILHIYLNESYLDRIDLPFWMLILFFAGVSLIYLLLNRRQTDPLRISKGRALLGVLWFSLLSPLSWYIIFKSLAYYHTQMNYLPWEMPFTIFGFGLCGVVIAKIFERLRWPLLSRRKTLPHLP